MVDYNHVERTLRRLNLILRTMREVDQIILDEKDRDRLIVRVCRRLVSTRGYYNSWIALLDGTERFINFAEAGVGTEFSLLTQQLKDGHLTNCAESALANTNSVVIDDPSSYCTDCPLAKKYSGRGGIAARLKYGERLYGILCASVPHSITTETQERSLFEDIAADIAFALYKIDLEKDRGQAEEALKESENRYRLLFDCANDGMMVHDLEGNIYMANNAIAQITGYSIDALLKTNINSFFLTSSQENTVKGMIEQIQDNTRTQTERYEFIIEREDGEKRLVDVVSSVLQSIGGYPIIQTIIRDITEQKRAQVDLRDYARRAILAQEEERKRVARELHDDTAQALVSLGMDINALAATKNGLPKKISERLEELRDRIDDTLKGVRSISQALRPPMLEEFGLVAALQLLIDDLYNQHNIKTKFEIKGTSRRLSSDIELTLFRVAQEASTNIAKHSGATDGEFELLFLPEKVILKITDNGKGIMESKIKDGSAYRGKLGLIGMRERAKLIDGFLTISSELGKGTTVVLEVKH